MEEAEAWRAPFLSLWPEPPQNKITPAQRIRGVINSKLPLQEWCKSVAYFEPKSDAYSGPHAYDRKKSVVFFELSHPPRPPHKIAHDLILRIYLTLGCGGFDKSKPSLLICPMKCSGTLRTAYLKTSNEVVQKGSPKNRDAWKRISPFTALANAEFAFLRFFEEFYAVFVRILSDAVTLLAL